MGWGGGGIGGQCCGLKSISISKGFDWSSIDLVVEPFGSVPTRFFFASQRKGGTLTLLLLFPRHPPSKLEDGGFVPSN